MKRKKLFFVGILIFLIISFSLLFIKLGSNNNNDEDNKDNKYLAVIYLLIDYDKTSEDDTLDNYAEYEDDILEFPKTFEKLSEDGEYYKAKLANINDIVFDNVTDYVFALNDVYGNVVTDLKFDLKTREVLIPKNYYDDSKYIDEYGNTTLQMEIVSRVKKDELETLKINTSVNKIFTTKRVYNISSSAATTDISIYKYKENGKLNKNDISVYVNGLDEKLTTDKYDVYASAGTLTINISPIYINDIKVVVNKSSILKRILPSFLSDASAATSTGYANKYAGTWEDASGSDTSVSISKFIDEYVTISSADYVYGSAIQKYDASGWANNGVVCGSSTIGVGNTFTCSLSHLGYAGAGSYTTVADTPSLKAAIKSAFANSARATEVAGADGTVGEQDNFLVDVSGLENKTISVTSSKKTRKITFNIDYKYIHLWCTEISDAAAGAGINLKITIKDIDDSIMKLYVASTESVGGQGAHGYIYLKKGASTSLKVKKYSYDNITTTPQETATATALEKKGIVFKLYGASSDGECSSKVLAEGTTDANGEVEFKGLESGAKYCVKEYYQEYDDDSSISSKEYLRANNITKTIIITPDPGSSTGSSAEGKSTVCTTSSSSSTSTCKYYNALVRYCFKIKKDDLVSNNNTSFKDGTVTFCRSNNGSTTNCATNIGNVITLSGFSYSDIKDGITFVESTNSSPANSSNEEYYNTLYNLNGEQTKITFYEEDATVMTLKHDENGYYWSCPSDDNAFSYKTGYDVKKYQCLKVKKVDKDTGAPLSGATFKAECSNGQTSTSETGTDGIATLYAGTKQANSTTTCKVTEITSPTGYSIPTPSFKNNLSVFVLSEENASIYAQTNDTKVSSVVESWCDAPVTETFTYQDTALSLNWYKVTENGTTRASGAYFSVKNSSNKTIYHTATKINTKDDNGVTKSCYQYSSTSTGTGSDVFESDANGEVCIRGVPTGTYTVTETKPAQYHTFNSVTSLKLTTQTTFASMNNSNKFINLPTEFEFTKTVSSGDGDEKIIVNGVEKTLSELTTEELRQIEFNVYDTNGNMLSFIQTSEGVYEYAGNTIDPTSGTSTTALYLNSERKIRIKHLPWGATYSIKEKETKVCNSSSDYDKCIGYYYPNYSYESDYKFTITNTYNSISTQSLTNTPTEITFTKNDFYGYYDESDVVDFVDDKERSDFDKITFKLKDSNGKYLTLKFIGNHGSCLTDDSYSEYRYVYSDSSDGEEGTELHTCGGHIKITNLCRGQKYTVEEISVPENSAFVKENTDSTPTEAEYIIPCTEDETTPTSTTNLISDKPTRVRFEKRDSKYNYLIPDETTTFKVYRCAKDETDCHPSDYSTDEEREKAGMKLIKFYPRSVITNDEEDTEDAEGLAGVEVYKAMSDSDVKEGTKYETELHPYKGILVFRYLQSGYTYVLVETVAPKNYTLPSGRNAETKFTVRNDTVSVDEVDVANKPTSLLIKKYSDNGNLLAGAQFRIYEKNTCDPNLTAKAQVSDGSATLMKLKTIRDGVYESRPVADTDTITTCTDTDDSKCSDIQTNEVTKLTYTDYLGTWADFDDESTQTKEGTKIELQEGEALVQYLEYGHCYIIEETKAPKGYSLPEDDEDRFTMVTIEENDEYAHDTYKSLINKPTPFTFYKYDEFNQLLDGAEFKLQKLDDNKKYHDITVTREELDGKVYYKVDDSTDNTVITTQNGSATVYYLEPGQYRIVETKAAPGKELSKNPNIATFFVDESGNVYGNSIIVNKSKTERIEIKNSASAELIVNIQTGQTVIKYGLIIAILIALISGLMIIRKKMKKREL